MVYISSSCIKTPKIIDAIQILKESGINSIELSGGTKPYKEILDDLKQAQNNLNVDLILHNYFPPPPVDFVLNLASLDENILNLSREHCKRAIDYSDQLGIKKYGFHAGFFMDIKVSEIGKKISSVELRNKEACYQKFYESYAILSKIAGDDVKLYIENNVFSKSNYESFEGVNPLMLTDLNSFNEIKVYFDFNLLLDVAHLKVSCNTLRRDFENDLTQLFQISDYIHVSDNNGLHDTNNAFLENSSLFELLKNQNWNNKIVTLEVYDEIDMVKKSLDTINLILHA